MDSNIMKDAIVDGYFKTFDIANRYAIGRARHKDLSVNDMLSYYKCLGITMTIVFLVMLSLMAGMVYFATIGNDLILYIMFGLYLAAVAPMIFFGFGTIRGWLK